MEVIISVNNIVPVFPKCIPPRVLNKELPYSRIGDVVDTVRKMGLENRFSTNKMSKSLLDKLPLHTVYSMYDSKELFYTKLEQGFEQVFRIVNVDCSAPWCIKKTRVGESIYYFSKDEQYEIIDEELMYAKKVGN